MIAKMNKYGTITIAPETGAEAFALTEWLKKAVLPIESLKHGETSLIRSSLLSICNDIGLETRFEGER